MEFARPEPHEIAQDQDRPAVANHRERPNDPAVKRSNIVGGSVIASSGRSCRSATSGAAGKARGDRFEIRDLCGAGCAGPFRSSSFGRVGAKVLGPAQGPK